MLVLSVGLLGLAALQAVSLKTNQSAYQRSQATLLAYDMMDRLRANRVKAMGEAYNRAMDAADMTGTAIEAVDVNDWINNYVETLLPAGDGSINCTTTGLCTVIVEWDESRVGGSTAPTATPAIVQFSFTAQI